MPNKDTIVQSSSQEAKRTTQPDTKKAFHSKEENPASLFSTLPYYLVLSVYALAYYSIGTLHQPWIASFVLFVLFPLGDIILPEDWMNPTPAQDKKLANDVFFKIPLYAVLIAIWAIVFWTLNHLTTEYHGIIHLTGTLWIVGALLSMNFTIAHELFHKHDLLGRLVGGATMTLNFYTHYFIEHQYGHHKNVATPNDTAFSRIGTSVTQYLPHSFKHVFVSAWEIEKRRLVEIEELSTHWHPRNRMIWYVLSYFAFGAFIYSKFGLYGLAIALYLAFQSVVLLQAIDYVEHYGLERKEISPGEYEKVNVTHSWNAPHRITNYILFKVQRHSDHHENAYKPYQSLASYDDSPTLPNGYAFCITMCFFPVFWFKTINPILLRHKKGEKITAEEKASIQRWMNAFMAIVVILFGGMMTLGFVYTD